MSGDQSGDDPRHDGGSGQAPPPPAAAPGSAGPYGAQPYGAQPYGQVAGDQGQQGGSGYAPAPGTGPYGAPVAKPGVVPLRQLTLGDMYSGAFQTIRRNPRASIGLAFAVSAVFMAIPLLGSLIYGVADLGPLDLDSTDLFVSGNPAFQSLNNAGTVLNLLATIVITGLMARVVGSAVVGRPMRAGEAWARTRGRLWALVGLSLLSLLLAVVVLGVAVGAGVVIGIATGSLGLAIGLGVLLGLVGLALLAFVGTRYLLLAAPALVLEGAGIGSAIRRAGRLSRGQFWRLLGITLLTQLVVGVASAVVVLPLGIASGLLPFLVGGSWGVALSLLVANLVALLSAALVSPFVAGVATLQYVDQRFRKEGLDITLLEQTLGDRPA